MQSENRYTLFYDHECPVCSSFVKLLKKKLPMASIEYVPLIEPSEQKDFKFVSNNRSFYGKEAIDELSKQFPSVLDYFWILPPEYRKEAARQMYGFASKIRTIYRKIMGRSCSKCNKT